jgi:1,5-anhydro-D-fructose reductase (1,5-anhydro-D-mannitol-forming)
MAEKWVGPAIVSTGGSVAGVVSRSVERGRQVAGGLSARAFGTVEDMLDDEALDAVYVSTTNERHTAPVLACLRAGVPVLVEKPIAATLDDARAMVDLSAEQNVPLGVNHHLRNLAVHRRARDLVADGAVGEVRAVFVHHAVLIEAQWRGWRLTDPGAGAGVALDLLTHSVDLLRFVLGRDVVELSSVAAPPILAVEGIDDHRMTVLAFDGGALGFCHDSYTVPFEPLSLRIVGERGALTVSNAMRQSLPMSLTVTDADGDRVVTIEPPLRNAYETGVTEFVNAATAGTAPPADGRDGLRALEIALTAIDSERR